jgi:hypothetical protein
VASTGPLAPGGPVEAYSTKAECEKAMKNWEPRITDYKKKYPEDFAYVSCLPDTVDLRGSKR